MHDNSPNYQQADAAVSTASDTLEVLDGKREASRISNDGLRQVQSTPVKRDSAISTTESPPSPRSERVKSTKEKVKSLGHGAKIKTKRLLNRHHTSPEEQQAQDDGDYENPYQDIQDDPAFEPSQLVDHKRKDAEAVTKRTVDNIVAGFKAVVHPRTAAKKKAASKVAFEDRPYISREADLEYLEAHDKLAEAKTRSDSYHHDDFGNATQVEIEEDNIRALEELRRSRKVAWTTSHIIRRVLVVPKREVPAPAKADFCVQDPHTGKQKLDWQSWLAALNKHGLQNFANNSMGHIDFASQPAFDRDVMVRQTERLLIASAPWQSWLSSLRQLYRWEDPRRTKIWFAVWFVVWWLDYVGTFILAYVVYLVLENKYRPKNVAALRASYDRARDRGSAVYKFNELINKHGSDKWIDPVIEQMGPKLQSQLIDAASFLEVLNNFYEWSAPEKTWATLFWFCCAIVLGATTSTQNSMKIVSMFCILDFFLGFWVASRYPQYRHVVNSLEWIFWDIPDDGESSMMHLRSKAQETRARLIEREVQRKYDHDDDASRVISSPAKGSDHVETALSSDDDDSDSDADSFVTADSSPSILDGLDILSFHCHVRGIRARLTILSDGLRLERLGKERWRRCWTELIEMCKTESSLAPGLPKRTGLIFVFTDGEEVKVDFVKDRDRVFNCIIGFSGLRFQVSQPVPGTDCRSMIKDMKLGDPKNGTLWPEDEKEGTG